MKTTNQTKKNVAAITTAGSFLLVNALTAACPVCLLVTGGSAGLSKYLKIDDTITGTWVGASIMIFASMTVAFLKKKKIDFPHMDIVLPVLSYISVFIAFYSTNLIGDPGNVFFMLLDRPIDKLLFGMLLGCLLFVISSTIHTQLKSRNHKKSYFPFQKVVIPTVVLAITSLILYFITRN